ncbi:2Fe-2S iron-sulfur cluster-binding protein [Agrobacterium pusense]|uniref:2Fe-2S iron-sulfur cluster-binding protein n=1 Tax=Agrobacterium pusense TaxID=648995 RepID=UPI001FCD0536
MISIIFKLADGQECAVSGREGDSVMQAAVAHGVPGVVGECGGSLACATCHCYVDEEWVSRLDSVDPAEDDMLDCTMAPRRAESRLTCQLTLNAALNGLVLNVPGENM